MPTNPNKAVFGPRNESIHIHDLTVDDPAVVRVVLSQADDGPHAVFPVIVKLLALGAAAVEVAGGRHEVESLRRQIDDATGRAERAVATAADHTTKLAEHAGQQLDLTRQQTARALSDAAAASAKQLAEIPLKVGEDVAKRVAGLDAAATQAVRDAVTKAVAEQQTAFETRMGKVVADVDQQWDPRNPASPVAQMTTAIEKNQQRIAEIQLDAFRGVAGKLDDLDTRVAEMVARATATAKTASVTPIKGATYEDAVHAVHEQVAASHGDGYQRTGNQPGSLGASKKKGDGVFTVVDRAGANPVKIVAEMHDGGSAPRDWSAYLDEAMRNRGAVAAIGLVRTVDQVPGGGVLRMWGTRQVLMAFDPDVDDPALLNAVIMLLRAQACLAAARTGDEQLHTAREQLAAATAQLEQFAEVEKLTTLIKANADKATTKVVAMRETLTRHVTAAMKALSEVADTGSGTTGHDQPSAAA